MTNTNNNNIRWTRTATIANGKFLEAIGWAKEVSGYVEKTFNTPTVNVYLDSFGPVGTIRWSIDFLDLTSVDKLQTSMMSDQLYWQLVDKAMKNGLFVDGSGVDTISRKL